jgi:transposase InsO family protein
LRNPDAGFSVTPTLVFACDFCTVTAFGFVTFYVFFIIKLETRRIVHYNVTQNPNIRFLRNQFSEFEYRYPGAYLIHDNSGEQKWFPYDQYNTKDVGITPYSPDMNACAERFVRSLRQECLDHFVIFTENQLRNVLKSYIDYYNNYRSRQDC